MCNGFLRHFFSHNVPNASHNEKNASVESNNTFSSPLLLAISQLSQLLREYGQKGNQYRGGRAQAPKVITKKQHTYIIPSSSPYFSTPPLNPNKNKLLLPLLLKLLLLLPISLIHWNKSK
jgi:hypothetical protein